MHHSKHSLFLIGGLLFVSFACALTPPAPPATTDPGPLTDTPASEPTSTPTLAPPTAVPGTPYADVVIDFVKGPASPASLSMFGYDPNNVLGPPDAVVDPCCSGLLPLGVGGSVTVEFVDNVALNGPGADLSIVGDPDNDEQIQVLVSMDGVTWEDFGLVGEMAELDLDILGLDFIRFVMIVDDEVAGPTGNNSAEIDAIEALHNGPPR